MASRNYNRRKATARTSQSSGRDFSISPASKGCKRCGSKTVAWQVGKSDKWYLVEIFEDADGRAYSEHTLFHSAFCGDPIEHQLEQEKRLKNDAKEQKTGTAISQKVSERNAAEDADYFLGLHDLCKGQPGQAAEKLGDMERERDRLVSSDTYGDTDARRVQRVTAEIAFMRAALGMVTEYEEQNGCDDCGREVELFHHERTGASLCEACLAEMGDD